ncbi:MAG: nitroreductase family protein [Bacteroidales bacterium]|nr:nitroreductase family protein [Bacteroidales bacterium]
MADNYLEKKYDEVFGGRSSSKSPKWASLSTLLKRNRSYRGYDPRVEVTESQLLSIVSVNTRIASSRNLQRLRFHPVTQGDDAKTVLENIRMAAALKELNLPLPGTEPAAFIIVCSTCEENPEILIDLGISLQSMLLRAVDLGLGGLIIRSFNKEEIKRTLKPGLTPLAVLAIGKPAERIELVPVHEGDSLTYYRKDGIHCVPKLEIQDLLV